MLHLERGFTLDTHHHHKLSINAAPLKGEMSLLFSGVGQPVEGHYIGPAVHDYYLIHIVLEGKGSFETLGERYELAAGDAFIVFPDILVKYEADARQPWKYMWAGFSGDIVEKSLRSIGITPDKGVVRGLPLPELNRLFTSLRLSVERNAQADVGNMEASGWLRLIIAELGRRHQPVIAEAPTEQPRSYRQIDQALRLIALQYGQQLSIEGIARMLGYHRAHLSRLFKEATGLSPMQYLFKVRMKKAEELLAGELTIAQIAASVGYQDPLFFTKQFHKWCGMSPTDFRKQMAEERH
jgi:AraC-like DNA-binding protein